MLKEVVKFKNAIDVHMKWYKKYHASEKPKMYVICTTKRDKNAYVTDYFRKSTIRPCDMSYKKFVNANKKCKGIHLVLDAAFYDVDFSLIDKNQFLLECSALGIMPEVEFIDDENGKAVDEIDLMSGKSFFEMRKKVLEKKEKRNVNKQFDN